MGISYKQFNGNASIKGFKTVPPAAMAKKYGGSESDYVRGSAIDKNPNVIAGDITTGILFHYDFNDDTANDKSGNNNNPVSAPSGYVVGRNGGRAINCAGSGYINTGMLQLTEFSVAMWLNIPTASRTNYAGIYGVHANPNFTGTTLQWDNTGFGFGGGTGSAWQQGTIFPEVNMVYDDWLHMVLTLDENNYYRGYLNGALVAERQYLPFSAGSNNIHFGRSYFGGSFTRVFNGLFDDIRYYNRGLSADDVQALYTST